VDEIIRDRVVLTRERNYNKNVVGYIFSKFVALSMVCLLQNIIYLSIGNSILEIRDMFGIYLLWMFLTSLCGVTLGMLVSSIVRDGKTAINIVPLVLVPQIILGGALIKYEEMNRNLDFVYSVRRWLNPSNLAEEGKQSELKVPFICEFMPLRWSYESLALSQVYLNPLDAALEDLEKRLDTLRNKETLTPEEEIHFEQIKAALPVVSSLHERNPGALHRRLTRILNEVKAHTFEPTKHDVKERQVTAEELYQNKKLADLISKAEFEVGDYRRRVREKEIDPAQVPPPNVFFGKQKRYLGQDWPTLKANSVALLGFILAPLVLLYFTLRRQLRRVK
jgi:hypothetical protein